MKDQQEAMTVTKEEQAGFACLEQENTEGERSPAFQGQNGYIPLKYTEISNLLFHLNS